MGSAIVMQSQSDTILDVWFRSPAALEEIVLALGLSEISFDAEDYWEWAIGALDGIQLDVTRSHHQPAGSVNTRVFRVDHAPISRDLLAELVKRLQTTARGSVSWGRWVYREGNDFDLQAVGQSARD